MKQFLRILRAYPILIFITMTVNLHALTILGHWTQAGDYDRTLTVLVLTLLLWGQLFWKLAHTGCDHTDRKSRLAAWALLLPGISFLIILPPAFIVPPSVSAWMLSTAALLFYHGHRTARHSLIPLLWSTVYISHQEELLLLISYPFRIITTAIAAIVLQMLKQPVVVNSATSLQLPEQCLAITYNCSGIQQLDIFMITALLLVQYMHSRKSWQVLHFLFIIPSIILANSCRLILTVFFFNLFGDPVLIGLPHACLGYFQLLLALVLFWIPGRLFQIQSPDKDTRGAA